MSDSDSDDFASLITNGEENFWKTYTTSAANPEDITEDFTEAPNSSRSSGNSNTITSKRLRISSNSSDETKTTLKRKPSVEMFSSYSKISDSSMSSEWFRSSNTNRSKQQYNSSCSLDEPKATTKRKSSINLNSSISESEQAEERRPAKNTKSIFQNIMQTLTTPTPSNISIINEAIRNPVESLPATSGTSSKGQGRKRITAPSKKPTRGSRMNLRSSSTINIPNPYWGIPFGGDESMTSTPSTSTGSVAALNDVSKTPPYKYENIDQLNNVVDVKILWKSIYLKIFKVRRFAPLKHIVDYFAKKEQIDTKKICFSVNDKIVNLNMHSCVTLNYKPHEEIEGAIVNRDIEPEMFNKEKGVKLKLRLERKTETVFLEDDIMLKHLYAYAALKFCLIAGKFKLDFDGKILNWYETIKDVGLKEEDCIDIFLWN